MTKSIFGSTLILFSILSLGCATKRPPSTGNDWISLSKGTEFQPASSNNPLKASALKEAQTRFLEEEIQEYEESEYSQQTMFRDTYETYYSGYSQAWRYVGFYTDCNVQEDDHRRLSEDGVNPCKRYLLWALYADLEYEGQGIGEYQFYDTYANEWDTSACETVGRSESECRKMDCHLPDTHFTLLGYFKHEEWSEWFEQLFKHEGYCVWQKGEYEFMYENYGSWPEECTETEVYTENGEALYYDLKPSPNATMAIGLYTDAQCSQDYMGDEYNVSTLIYGGSDNDDDFLTEENVEYFDKAMDIYRVCQPCRAYALNDYEQQYDRKKSRRLDDNNGNFQCDDAAGYTNVNQCMKFRTQTEMEYATFNEVWTAAQQGGITTVTVGERTYGSYLLGSEGTKEKNPNLLLFFISLGTLAIGVLLLTGVSIWSYRRRGTCSWGDDEKHLEESLLQNEDVEFS